MFYYLTVEVCPALDGLQNSTLNTSLAVHGTVVQAACKPGFVFPFGGYIKYLRCGDGRIWNDTLEDCQGMTIL
jgi:hypothetical protein